MLEFGCEIDERGFQGAGVLRKLVESNPGTVSCGSAVRWSS